MMKNYKDTYQNTLTASGKNNLKELARLTLLNILSVQGVIYTHYKNNSVRFKNKKMRVYNKYATLKKLGNS